MFQWRKSGAINNRTLIYLNLRKKKIEGKEKCSILCTNEYKTLFYPVEYKRDEIKQTVKFFYSYDS